MDVNGGDIINKTVQKSSKHKIIVRSLDWDDYLKFCLGKPAPANYFNHHIDPPINEFQINQKLEVTSPDNRDFVHLATVVGFMGPRLQLRLDGCDNSNDFFELVDSEAIGPIGTCKSKNRLFAAPLRFRKDAATYGAFCKQVLKNSVHAPKNCFKSPPKRPDKNYFEPGMKLEAVDKKHPSNICPATIKSVENSDVEIHLDGWDHNNDYKCTYYSRNLFPVGWCKKTGHILQLPGPKAEYEENNIKRQQQDSSINLSNHEHLTNSNHVFNDNKNNNNNLISTKGDDQKSSLTNLNSVTALIDTTSTLTRSSHQTLLPLDHQNTKKETNVIDLQQRTYNNSIANKKNNRNDISIPNPLIVVDSSSKHKSSNSFPNKNINNNSESNHHNITSVIDSSASSVPSILVHGGGKKRHFDQINVEKSFDNNNKMFIKSSSSTIVNGKRSSSSLEPEYQLILPSKHLVNSWSVEELVEFLNLRFPEFNKFEHQFRSQEIDGKAFLMLTNDLIMKFLNIKLGYSLKIIDLIDKINSSESS